MDSDTRSQSSAGGRAQDDRATIMVVEDDPAIALTLQDLLDSEGYRVVHVANGAAARGTLEEASPDLIILDLMLPDADGLVLCADLKARRDVPIIICSATNRKRDAVLGFKLGADDFIAKPFHIEELLTRIQAALRRAATRPQNGQNVNPAPAAGQSMSQDESAPSDGGQVRSYRVGDLLVDHARRSVRLGNVPVDLTPTEYRLVAALASRPEEVLSRQDLAQIVWGYQDASIGRSIDVHLHRLRTKLKDAGSDVVPPSIISVRGFGYKITTQETEGAVSAA